MIHIIYGTRAELIKMSGLIKQLKKNKINFELVNTGQHDTEKLRKSLDLPKPHHNLGKSYRGKWSSFESRLFTYPVAVVLAATWGIKTLFKIKNILKKSDLIIVHGNTMGVPLTIYASKLNRISGHRPKILHLESGMRGGSKSSGLLDMFRKIGENNSDILVTTTKTSKSNLSKIGFGRKTKHIGNLLDEIVKDGLKKKPKVKIKDKNYILISTIRSIVKKKSAEELLKLIIGSKEKIYFIVNPVIERRLSNFGLLRIIKRQKNVKLLKPMDYIDFLHAMNNSSCVITDSEGIVEEASIVKTPCIVTNDFIQTPELIKSGVAKLTGWDSHEILHELHLLKSGKGMKKSLRKFRKENSINSSKKLVKILEEVV